MGFFTFRVKKRRTMRRKSRKGGMFRRLKDALGFKPKNVASSTIKDPKDAFGLKPQNVDSSTKDTKLAVIEKKIMENKNTPDEFKNIFHLANSLKDDKAFILENRDYFEDEHKGYFPKKEVSVMRSSQKKRSSPKKPRPPYVARPRSPPKEPTPEELLKESLIENLISRGYNPIDEFAHSLLHRKYSALEFKDADSIEINKGNKEHKDHFKKEGQYYYYVTDYGVVPRGGYEIFGSKSKNGPWVSIKSNWG
jgi:hypothetical protein